MKINGPNTIVICRMPADSCIAVIKYSLLSHQYFSCSTLFSRATIKSHCSKHMSFFQHILYRYRCSYSRCSQDMMTASMAVSSWYNRLSLGLIRFLADSRQSIKFAHKADNWGAFSPLCNKSSLQACCLFLNPKAFCPYHLSQPFRRTIFFKNRFRMFPDKFSCINIRLSLFVNRFSYLFISSHFSSVSPAARWQSTI